MSDEQTPKPKSAPIFAAAEIPKKKMVEMGLRKNDEDEDHLAYFFEEEGDGTKKKIIAPRMSLTEDPNNVQNFAGIFKMKTDLLPDWAIKKIRIQNHLVANILQNRANMLSLHGHIRKDRFDVGIEVIVKPEFEDVIRPAQMLKIKERIARFENLLMNCGHTEGLEKDEHMTLPTFMNLCTRNGLSFGRHATEIIYSVDQAGNKKFHRFRPVDAGTIYKTVDEGEGAEGVRADTIRKIKESLRKAKIEFKEDLLDAFVEDKFAWAQVVNGIPKRAFTSEELLVDNLYPSTDVEHHNYPVTPLDTSLNAVLSLMHIATWNRLFFQNGRASKGILVIKSEGINKDALETIRQDFQASINGTQNAFRVPIFGVDQNDDIQWQPMTSSSGDGEFQQLFDQTCRDILSAFGMSPDEISGYGHLSRGSNQQTLSESNNEFKMTAVRDSGLRPLILKFQSFFNESIFPLIDKELSKICTIQFSGIDAKTREQESVELVQNAPLYMDYDAILKQVDQNPVGPHLGGSVPFNERYQLVLDKYLTVGEVKAAFMNDPTALMDVSQEYCRDNFWAQYNQVLAQSNPLAIMARTQTPKYYQEMLTKLLQDQLEEMGE